MKLMRAGSLLLMLLATACVTINIYFPAAEAKEAAEQIVGDILSQPGAKKPQTPPPAPDKGSSLKVPVPRPLAESLLDLLIPKAEAGQPNFSVNTPEIRKLQASMKKRNAALRPYYQKGAIGFTTKALVAVRDNSAIALKDRTRVKRLVAAENADRNHLYRAIAKANGHPEWEQKVRAVFAGTWVDKAPGGWWYQNARGQWARK